MRTIDVSGEKPVPVADPGAAPMLQWVKIADLAIDDAFQRPLGPRNWSAIRKIAAEFSWSRFSPVFCAPIAGGRFSVIDGQHRAHAAALCGFDAVPAQIVQMAGPEQARAFAAINGAVTKVTLPQIYRAALAAGAPWAVEADATLREAGCRLLPYNKSSKELKPGEVTSVKHVRRWIEAGQTGAVRIALGALARSTGGLENVEFWRTNVLCALVDVTAVRDWLTEDLLVELLDRVDLHEMIGEAEDRARKGRRAGVNMSVRELIADKLGVRLDVLTGRAEEEKPAGADLVVAARPSPAKTVLAIAAAAAAVPAAPVQAFREGDWSAADDHRLLHETAMGKSDGRIAHVLSRRPPEIRARRDALLAEFGGDIGRALKGLTPVAAAAG